MAPCGIAGSVSPPSSAASSRCGQAVRHRLPHAAHPAAIGRNQPGRLQNLARRVAIGQPGLNEVIERPAHGNDGKVQADAFLNGIIGQQAP